MSQAIEPATKSDEEKMSDALGRLVKEDPTFRVSTNQETGQTIIQGMGELQAAFELLKEKLLREGLFDDEFKKPIPEYPLKIGIVTAIDGAALKDMISVAKRRFPALELVIAHARVQGAGAAESISEAIKALNDCNDIDVIILARGGGSIEDLWAFNEEIVARSVFKSKIPVVTGIGHQVDFTIADFVADVRAATPTAAMEHVTPDIRKTVTLIEDLITSSAARIEDLIDNDTRLIGNLLNSYSFRIPADLIKKYSQTLDLLIYRIGNGMDNKFLSSKNKIELLISKIELNNIDKTLKKGFVLVKQEDKFVKRAKDFLKKKPFSMQFYDDKINIPD